MMDPAEDFVPAELSLRRKVALIGMLGVIAWFAVIGVVATISFIFNLV